MTDELGGIESPNPRLTKAFFSVRAMRIAFVAFVLAVTSIACSDEKVVPKSASTAEQSPSSSPAMSPSPKSGAAAPMSSGGDPIDTTKFDADINRAEASHAKKPNDAVATGALARAYLARAGALTKARQYRSALGDYRRTLKYDPKNQEAREMADQIVGIMQSMGRDVPKEGEEPQPMPMPAKQ